MFTCNLLKWKAACGFLTFKWWESSRSLELPETASRCQLCFYIPSFQILLYSSSLPLLLPLPTGFLVSSSAYIRRQVSYCRWLGATLQATAEGTGSCCSGARQRRLNQRLGVWRPEKFHIGISYVSGTEDSFQSAAAVGWGFKSAIIQKLFYLLALEPAGRLRHRVDAVGRSTQKMWCRPENMRAESNRSFRWSVRVSARNSINPIRGHSHVKCTYLIGQLDCWAFGFCFLCFFTWKLAKIGK